MSYTAAFTGNIITFISTTTQTWTSPILSKLEDAKETPFASPLSPGQSSWISSILSLGAIFGPFIYGYLVDKIGRKPSLLVCGVPFLVSYLLLAFGKTPWLYYVARFIAGTSLGGVFTVIPMYVGEIAEDSNRDALGVSMNCFICLGYIFSYAVGPFTSITTFNLILAAFPAVYLVLFFLLAPESPQYYVNKRRDSDAKITLQKIRRGEREKTIEKEMSDMQAKVDEERGTFFDIFKHRSSTRAFRIGLGLIFFQQFSGISTVLFYAQDIFQEAGTSLEPDFCSIIIGCTQFATSFVSPLIVERVGSKFLLLLSLAGVVLSEVPLGIYSFLHEQGKDVSNISFVPIVCLIGFIIAYNTGIGPVPWAMLGELFPANIRSIATSTITSISAVLGFLIVKYFKSVSTTIGMSASFWIFAGCSLVAMIFTHFYVIETKGKSLEEIQESLSR